MAVRVFSKNATDPRSVLVVLPTWVGDFVMATPALRAIRNRFPSATIAFLIEPNLRELVAGGDWMDECIEWPAKNRRSVLHTSYRALVKRLRSGQILPFAQHDKSVPLDPSDPQDTGAARRSTRQPRRGGLRFDLAILFPNSFRAAMVAYLAGAKRRVGYARDGRSLLLTDAVPVRHRRKKRTTVKDVVGPNCPIPIGNVPKPGRLPVKPGKYIPFPIVEYYAELVEAIGCEHPGDALELFTTSEADASMDRRFGEIGPARRRPLVVICPGASFGASKCWPPERFAAVADRLIEAHKASVIVTCGPGEQKIAAAIGLEMKRDGLVFDAPPLSLGELKSLIKRCDLLICNDAGPRHFAKAFGAPVVTVFGPTHPDWTATTYALERIVRVDVDCGPCQQKTCPLGHHECMTGVSVDAVYKAARRMLTAAPTQSR